MLRRLIAKKSNNRVRLLRIKHSLKYNGISAVSIILLGLGRNAVIIWAVK
jgi:hypothetical protein